MPANPKLLRLMRDEPRAPPTAENAINVRRLITASTVGESATCRKAFVVAIV